MSKTFESSRPTGTLLRVEPIEIFNEAHLTIVLPSREEDICIAPSDAPALALAILEAAGYGEEVATDGSPDGHIQVAKYYLYEGVKAHASITAEAEAQAKLEDEALELRHAYFGDVGSEREWSDLTIGAQSTWITVARRAREMREEK